MPTSPLEKVSLESLDVLFNTDPGDLDEAGTLRIIEALRKDRERFAAEPEKRAPASKVTKVKLVKKSAGSTLSLEDLGLDL